MFQFSMQEILQNAEDAGARTVKFLYDENSYGDDVSQLYHPGLAEFQVSWRCGVSLTHCGLVMPYGDIDLGRHWLR